MVEPLLIPTLPGDAAYACLAVDPTCVDRLFPEERMLLPTTANPHYVASFAAGRIAAREAMLTLGEPASPILRGERGMPVWPPHLRGSLTHKRDLAVAIVVRAESYVGVGIDLEIHRSSRHRRFSASICTANERTWLAQFDGDRDAMLLAIFSAKESIFKALYPTCRRYFGFQAAELTLSADRDSFTGTLLEELHPQLQKGFSLRVGLHRQSDLIFTHALLKSPI